MYPISPIYEQYLRRRDRIWVIKADINGVEYGMDKIVEFEIDNSLVLGEELEIGTATLSQLTIKLRTQTALPSNARIIPYVSLNLGNLTWQSADIAWEHADVPWDGSSGTDWLPLGEFYVDSRIKVGTVWEYKCFDKLTFADVPYISSLTYPATMQAVWDEICTRLGYAYDSTVNINPAYTVPVAPTGYSMRQVLGFIAGAHVACVYAGKDGTIKWRRFTASDASVYDMGPSDYFKLAQTNPVKSYSRVVVTYDTEDNLTYESGSGDEAHTIQMVNPMVTQAIVDDMRAALNKFAYVPVQMDARGYPQIEPGDRLRLQQHESVAWINADVLWEDADFTWDGISTYETIALRVVYVFKGGLGMMIDASAKAEQASEFKVEGTLEQQVRRVNQAAVKKGRNYYGVTITPEDGLIIQRSDGAAKAIFNADELSFWAGSSRALWFDVPANRYKFSGTLEAVDGVFTGTLQAASGTFTGSLQGGTITIGSGNNVFRADTQGIWAGHSNFANAPFRVSMAGQLYATNANITGTIQGSSILGSFIQGGTVEGALIRTASTGARIELSSSGNFLWAINSSGSTLLMNPNYVGAPALQWSNGSGSMLIGMQPGVSTIQAGGGVDLGLVSSGNIRLNPSGVITVPSWYSLWSNGNLQSLGERLDYIEARLSALEQ